MYIFIAALMMKKIMENKKGKDSINDMDSERIESGTLVQYMDPCAVDFVAIFCMF